LGLHIILESDFYKQNSNKININKMIYYLSHIQKSYHNDNPYHNYIHACDVLFNVYWLMNHCKFYQTNFSPFEKFVMLTAAIIHDVDHNGHNNDFHKRTRSNLALRYNDQSVLENHHVSYAFRIMQQDDQSNWLSEFDTDIQNDIRKLLIRLVIGTDMAQHKQHEDHLNSLIQMTQSVSSQQQATPLDEPNEETKKK